MEALQRYKDALDDIIQQFGCQLNRDELFVIYDERDHQWNYKGWNKPKNFIYDIVVRKCDHDRVYIFCENSGTGNIYEKDGLLLFHRRRMHYGSAHNWLLIFDKNLRVDELPPRQGGD